MKININNYTTNPLNLENSNPKNPKSLLEKPSNHSNHSNQLNEQIAVVNNINPNLSSRLRNDFDSQKVKEQITTKLNSDNSITSLVKEKTKNFSKETLPSSTDYKVQVIIKNLLQVSSRLEKNAAKYCNRIESDSNHLKNSIKNYLIELNNYSQKLDNNSDKIKSNILDLTNKEVLQIESLNSLVKETSFSVEDLTQDFLYSTHKNLQELTSSSSNLSIAAKDLSNGNAFAILGVLNSFENIKSTPEKISKEHKEYQLKLNENVNSLANNSKLIADNLPISKSSEINSLKTSLLALAKSNSILDATYRFNYPNEYTAPLVKAYYQSLQNLTNSILFPDTNPKGKPISQNLLVLNTNDLRETIKLAEKGDSRAEKKLETQYGYNLDNAPRAGQMWLAANFVGGDLDSGLVTAKNFPASSQINPVDTNLPEVKKLLFGKDLNGQVALKNKEGKTLIASSLEEYQKIVAENRSKAGIPTNNGEPQAVHVSFEGGGGFGKRHSAAVAEMYNLGLVPASVSGVSAGSISAGLIAAGLSPNKADEVSKDPKIKKFLEVNPLGGPGLTTGREFYRYMDQKLREITGIKDRPVTFADLKMPLYIGATKLADSQAQNDMTKLEDRIFVFSKETTPDTPVAMAMTASAAVPGSFDPVVFVDVATGRTIRLVDGGMINNLPIGYQKNNLPEIALKLQMPNTSNPDAKLNNSTLKPFSPGNLVSYTSLGNTQIGVKLYLDSAQEARNFKQRTNPPPGVFVLNLPTWNLKNFVDQDNVVDYQYDKEVDPELDKQTYQLTDEFFRQFFTQLNDPSKSGTNLKPFDRENSFSREFSLNGVKWKVERQSDSDKVIFRSDQGEIHNITLGKERLANWLADDASFGDLVYRLKDVLVDYNKYAHPFGI
ncbi:MAG: patatin-like phospholipase family protein [Acidobacteria bacterium]|nr:patatin-like phospholipase family protein [Acidobacteriota bacterium]